MLFMPFATSARLFSSNGSNIPRTEGIKRGLPMLTKPTYGKFFCRALADTSENAPMELKPTARTRFTKRVACASSSYFPYLRMTFAL